MFKGYTEQAIKAIMLGQEEARRLGHDFVDIELLLLGLIKEGTGVAAKVLKSMGVTLINARIEVEAIIGRGSGFVAIEIPFTPKAQEVLRLSSEEAAQLRHNDIGTGHLLLALIRESEGVAARVLKNLSIDFSQVQTQVIWMLRETIEVVDEAEFEPEAENQKESDRIIQVVDSPSENNPTFKPAKTIEVVYLYSASDKDENLRSELEKHLIMLQREGAITWWGECEITAGEEWESQIENRIDTAGIILPLVSSDFIASDDCYDKQFELAIKRYENAEAYIMPVLLRAVDWKEKRFGDMPVLPRNGTPITSWTNIDEAFQDIAKGIRELIQELWQRDERGVKDAYEQLKKELAAREWRKADEATKAIVFKVLGQEQTGKLTTEDIKNFRFQDIYVIDKLWSEHSNGHFGLSVQKHILQQKNYKNFVTDLGWCVDDSWSEYENLDFTINAPLGHLPYCGVHFWKAEPSVPPESPTIPYYRLDRTFDSFYNRYHSYRIPPNYYRQQENWKRELSDNIKPSSELEQLLNSPSLSSPPVNNRPGGASGGGLIALMAAIVKNARAAAPWVVGTAVVIGLAYAGYKAYEKYQEDKERQQKENEIKSKVETLLSRLDSII